LQYKARRFDLRVLEPNSADVEARAAQHGFQPSLGDYCTGKRDGGGAGSSSGDGVSGRQLRIMLLVRPRKAALERLQAQPDVPDLRPLSWRQEDVQQQQAEAQPVQQQAQQQAQPAQQQAPPPPQQQQQDAAAGAHQPQREGASVPSATAMGARAATPPLDDARPAAFVPASPPAVRPFRICLR